MITLASHVCVDPKSSAGSEFSVDVKGQIVAITIEHVSGQPKHGDDPSGTNFGSGFNGKWLTLVISDRTQLGTINEDETIMSFSNLNIVSPQEEIFKLYFPDSDYGDNSGVACYNVYATLGTKYFLF